MLALSATIIAYITDMVSLTSATTGKENKAKENKATPTVTKRYPVWVEMSHKI